MKAGVSSKPGPPTKKQKRVISTVEDEADVEMKGASEKQGTEDIGNKRVLLSIMHSLSEISSKLDSYDDRFMRCDDRFNNYDDRFDRIEERLTRYESRDINITDLVRGAVQEYLSKVPEQQSLSLPPPPPPPPSPSPPPPPHKSFPQASVTSPPAKASVNSPPAKATDVDFVTISPSKDPAIGRGSRIKLKVNEVTEKAELAKKEAAPKKAELAKKEAPKKDELKQSAELSRKEKAEIKRKEKAELKKKKTEENKAKADLKKKQAEENKVAAELKKNAKPEEAPRRVTRRGVITVAVPQAKPIESNSVADITDQYLPKVPEPQQKPIESDSVADITAKVLAELDEVLPESDEEEEEDRVRSARIKEHRLKQVRLCSTGRSLVTVNAPSPPVFPLIGDNGTTCMRKNVLPSPAIYDPLAPADPKRLENLQKLMEKFKVDPSKPEEPKNIAFEGDFYRIMVTPRPWPDDKYGWLYDEHIGAYLRVLMKRSMQDPTPFFSKRIAFIDTWFLLNWCHDYTQFKINPAKMKFKDTGYEELVNGKIPQDIPTNLKWYEDVDHLYGVIQTGGDHWVAFHVDLFKEKIDCYDPIIGHVTPESEQRVLNAFKPILHMLPTMLNETVPASLRQHKNKKFGFRRRSAKNIPQNRQVGDCGVYALKFVECLALGVTFDGINDKNIQGIRMKMAADILAESGKHDMYNQFEEV